MDRMEKSSGDIFPQSKNSEAFLAIYVLAFFIAESLTVYVSSVAGIILYFAILIGLIIISSVAADEKSRNLWLVLNLGPIVRIISLVMPMVEISAIFSYLIVAIPVFICIISLMRVTGIKFEDAGLNWNRPLIQILLAILGLGFGVIDYLILKPQPLIDTITIWALIPSGLILLLSTGFVEELVFRGLMQHVTGYFWKWGWIIIAFIYTVTQIGYGSIMHCVFVFFISLLFGWLVKRTGSISGVILAHGLMNIMLLLIIPNLIKI